MSRGGHNRTPDSVKKLRGTTRKDRQVENAPKIDSSAVPAPPKSLTKVQKEVWAELAIQVDALGVYAASDFTAFRLLVETVAETRKFNALVPATARVRTRQVAAGLLQRFGLDPGSRGRVSGRKQSDGDEGGETPLFGEPLRSIPGGAAGCGE